MKKPHIVIFIGPPGAGKGSLSQMCVKNLGWIQLSTGYLCRKHIAEQTEVGKQIDFIIKSGKLIDDKLVIDMVEQWLDSNATQYQGVILDGFPRTVAQAQALNDIVRGKLSFCKLSIIRLVVSYDTVIDRLVERFVCQNKDCQMVYSKNEQASFVKPKFENQCDICKSVLIRRADDELSAVHERLKLYKGHEQYLMDFYNKQGQNISEINVERPLDVIFEDFKCVINSQ